MGILEILKLSDPVCRPEKKAVLFFDVVFFFQGLFQGSIFALQPFFSRYFPGLKNFRVKNGAFGGKKTDGLRFCENMSLEGMDGDLLAQLKRPSYFNHFWFGASR